VEDSTVVTSLQVKLSDGRILTAKIEEETKAAERYDDAIASGNTAFMAKQDEKAPDRMILSIGNLAPGESVEVMIVESFPVKCEGESWRLFLPASLVPLCSGVPQVAG
jgi:hypothetical protein